MKEFDKDLNLLLDSLYWIKRINTVYQKNYEDPEDYKDLICKNLENIGISLGEVSDKTRSLFPYSKEDWKKKIKGVRFIYSSTPDCVCRGWEFLFSLNLNFKTKQEKCYG